MTGLEQSARLSLRKREMPVPSPRPRAAVRRAASPLIELAIVLADRRHPVRVAAPGLSRAAAGAGAGGAVVRVHGGAALRARRGAQARHAPSPSAPPRRAARRWPARARARPTGAAAGSCSPTASGAACSTRPTGAARPAAAAAQRRRGRHARQHQLHRRGLQHRRVVALPVQPAGRGGARRAAARDGVRQQAGPAAPGRQRRLRLNAARAPRAPRVTVPRSRHRPSRTGERRGRRYIQNRHGALCPRRAARAVMIASARRPASVAPLAPPVAARRAWPASRWSS